MQRIQRAAARRDLASPGGFSLLETLIAAAMMTAGVLSVAGLVTASTQVNERAAALTLASVLAQQKIEQLRALTWGYDEAGVPSSDVSSDVVSSPELPFGGTGLSDSPPTSLQENVPGLCDFFGAGGQLLSGGPVPPGAVFVRRWSIQGLPVGSTDGLVIQVRVRPVTRLGAALSVLDPSRRLPDEARIVSLKVRKAQ